MGERRRFGDQVKESEERGQEEMHTTPPKVLDVKPLDVPTSGRTKVNWELNAGVAALLQHIAKAVGISPAAAATRFIYDGLERYAADEIGFDGYLEASRSPRYQWVVSVDVAPLIDPVSERVSVKPNGGD